jgi:hypothetical protein
MSTEMSTQQAFAERVKAKLKKDFADMIPDDLLGELVAKAEQEFYEKDLPGYVKARLKIELDKRMDAEFSKPEWQSVWSSGNYGYRGQAATPGALMQACIRENAPLLVEAMFAGIVMNQANNLRTLLGRGY